MNNSIAKRLCFASLTFEEYLAATRSFTQRYLGTFALCVCGFLIFGLREAAELFAQCGGPGGSCATPDFDPTLIEHSVGNLFLLIEGAFGALIMVVAGIGAIFAAAMGAYRAAVGMLVVAVGAFILRALVTLFFGGDFTNWSDGNI